MSKKIKILIFSLVAIGILGGGLKIYENKTQIKTDFTKDIDVSADDEFNLRVQKDLTSVKSDTTDILQYRKINTEIDRLTFQTKVNNTINTINQSITDLNTIKPANSNQQTAKEDSIVSLNELKYDLTKIYEESQKDNFKLQGNQTVDDIFTSIANTLSKIDDDLKIKS